MADRRREYVVGLVALIGLIALVVLTVQIRGTSLFEGTYTVHTRFQRVAGSLTPGASILVYGVKVGEVVSIRIDPVPELPDHPVVIELSIRKSMTIYENAVIEIQEAMILGETQVIVTPGSPPAPALEDGATLIGTESIDIFDELMQTDPELVLETLESILESVTIVKDFLRNLNEEGKISDAIDDLAIIISAVRDMIAEGDGDVSAMIANINRFAEELPSSLERFNVAIDEVRDQISMLRMEMIDLLQTIHLDTQDRLVQLGNILDDVEGMTSSTSASWEVAVENLTATTESLRVILGRLEEGEGSLGLLLTDESLYQELVNSLAAANRWIAEIDAMLVGTEEPLEERVVPYDQMSRTAP
ncbi:MCE family protein [Candidatus Sumerlaeota bacterium]|nr:MCE family protein [Candidatus Sumerlaeota bacterium]